MINRTRRGEQTVIHGGMSSREAEIQAGLARSIWRFRIYAVIAILLAMLLLASIAGWLPPLL